MMSESSPPISGICCIREFSQQDHGGTLHGHLQLEGFGLKGEYRGLLLVLHITFTLSCSPHHEVQGLSQAAQGHQNVQGSVLFPPCHLEVDKEREISRASESNCRRRQRRDESHLWFQLGLLQFVLKCSLLCLPTFSVFSPHCHFIFCQSCIVFIYLFFIFCIVHSN